MGVPVRKAGKEPVVRVVLEAKNATGDLGDGPLPNFVVVSLSESSMGEMQALQDMLVKHQLRPVVKDLYLITQWGDQAFRDGYKLTFPNMVISRGGVLFRCNVNDEPHAIETNTIEIAALRKFFDLHKGGLDAVTEPLCLDGEEGAYADYRESLDEGNRLAAQVNHPRL